MMNNTFYNNQWSELYHFGIKGMQHGKRLYQNPDGSLTPLGYQHYGYGKRHTKHVNMNVGHSGGNPQAPASKYRSSNGGLTEKGMKKYNRMLLLEKANMVGTDPLALLKRENRKLLFTKKKDFQKQLASNKQMQREAADYLDERKKRIKSAVKVGAGLAIAATAAKAYRLSGSTFIGDHMNETVKRKLTSFSYSPVARQGSRLVRRYGKGVAAGAAVKYAIGKDRQQLKKVTNSIKSNNTKAKK